MNFIRGKLERSNGAYVLRQQNQYCRSYDAGFNRASERSGTNRCESYKRHLSDSICLMIGIIP